MAFQIILSTQFAHNQNGGNVGNAFRALCQCFTSSADADQHSISKQPKLRATMPPTSSASRCALNAVPSRDWPLSPSPPSAPNSDGALSQWVSGRAQ